MKIEQARALLIKELNEFYKKYLQPLNEEERRKLTGYFYILLTLVSVSFFGLFAISPTFNTISNLNKQYQDDKTILDGLETKLSNLKSLDNEYVNLENNLDEIYSAIPKKPEIPKLMRQVETLAATDNVQITNLNMNTVEIYPNSKTDPIFSYIFTVDVSGNQHDVLNFLSDFINFDRIVGLNRVSTGQNQESKYTLSITARAFFAQ
jgi:Tfp pilus assembly protein PilO